MVSGSEIGAQNGQRLGPSFAEEKPRKTSEESIDFGQLMGSGKKKGGVG